MAGNLQVGLGQLRVGAAHLQAGVEVKGGQTQILQRPGLGDWVRLPRLQGDETLQSRIEQAAVLQCMGAGLRSDFGGQSRCARAPAQQRCE